jgi:DNA polymerase-3 subunit epsilon
MKLPIKLDRPIAFFDLETTGLDPKRDRIVELAIILLSPDKDDFQRVRRFSPGIPIHPEASAVHGIFDEDLVKEAPFESRARNLFRLLDPCDLGGFNVRRFDLPMLIAEFARCGIQFDHRNRRIIDVQTIYHRKEPRDLSAAARFYLDVQHTEAHTAMSDIQTTVAVLDAQLTRYPDLSPDMDSLHSYCDRSPLRIGFDEWFRREGEEIVFVKGKNKGQTLKSVAADKPDYLYWMQNNVEDLHAEAKKEIEKVLVLTTTDT